MLKFKYILFKVVLVVITLHTIVSHPHSEELTKEKHLELHKNANSLIGIIRLTLHESNDESLDNLVYTSYECLKKIDFKVKHPDVSTFNDFSFIVHEKETSELIISNTDNFKILLFVQPNGLRGPPSLT